MRKIDQTNEFFEKTALPKPTNECESSGTPNNVYGKIPF